MTRKIYTTIIILFAITQNLWAQLNFVYENLRSTKEENATKKLLAKDTIDPTEWSKVLNKVSQSMIDQEGDYKKSVTSLAHLFDMYAKIKNEYGMDRCYQKIQYIAEKNNDNLAYLQAIITKAGYLMQTKSTKEGIRLFKEGERYLMYKEDEVALTTLYLKMALEFAKIYDYNLCNRYILRALDQVENHMNNDELLAKVYYRAALLYLEIGEFNKAKGYTLANIFYYEKTNDVENSGINYTILGDIYRHGNQNILAIPEYEKAIDRLHKTSNKYFLAKAYNGLAITMMNGNEDSLAMQYMRESQLIREKINNNVELSEIYCTLGNYFYNKVKEIDSAEYYYEKAFNAAFSKNTRYYKFMQESALVLSKIKERKGDIKKALEYERLAYLSFENITSRLNNKEVATTEMQYVLEQERLTQRQVQEHNMAMIRQSQRTIIIVSILGSLAAIASIVSAVLFIKKKKKNRQLREQRAELEKLSLVARQTDNSIFLTDANGKIIWLNEAFTRHSGFDINDYLEQNSSIMKASSNPDFQNVFNRIKETKIPETYTSQTFRKDGKKIWIQTTLSPALNDKGEITMFIAVCSDITNLKMAELTIAEQHKEITDSMEYARKIQNALEAPKIFVDYVLGNHFCINMPKNIVSGDFHWVGAKDDKSIFALADCTGHGIPGGFMSMLGQVILTNVINDIKDVRAGSILNQLRNNIIKLLHQRGRTEDTQDGMDGSMFVFDPQNMTLNYAAAYSLAYLIKFGTPDEETIKTAEAHQCQIVENDDHTAYIIKLKGDRFPVGVHAKDQTPFSDIYFHVNDGDIVYASSDGYTDQFGGDTGNKKYHKSTFERNLLKNCHLPFEEQKAILIKEFKEWKGEQEQTDDVHILGIELRKNISVF